MFESWQILLAAVLLTASALAAVWAWRQRLGRRRQQSLRRLLDLADEMERLLHRLRARMQSVQSVVERVPADIGAAAHASLGREDLIQTAFRDLLEHRLWIQRCGHGVSDGELLRACEALEQAKIRIGAELQRLERAGNALERAADAASAEVVDTDRGRRA